MSEHSGPNKKILENSPFSGIAVPIAIVLIGALIIFGVTKMLSSGKNHRDLIQEMNSKAFGNRWVAAYELSKFLASQKIPQEDMPWVIENLGQVYKDSLDPRTRNFVVLALGSLKNPLALKTLNTALSDFDAQVKFNAVVSLGNMSEKSGIDWEKIEAFISQDQDPGLQQVSLLTLASHNHPKSEEKSLFLIGSLNPSLRYAAASVLIKSKNSRAIPVIQEIFALPYNQSGPNQLNGAQVEGLKVNILENLEKYKWQELSSIVEKVEGDDSNIRVNTKAKQVLKGLKN